MIPFLLSLGAFADTPMTTSPELIEPTATLELPIEKAVVYNTKAQIFRAQTITLKKGVNVFSCADLPHNIDIKSLRVQIPNARILRLVPTVAEKEQFDIKELNTLFDKIYAVDQDIKILQKENSVLQAQYNLLTNIKAPNNPIKEAPLSLARNWKSNVDFFEKRQTSLSTKQYRIQQKLRKKRKEMEELKIQAQPYQSQSITKKQVQVLIFIDSTKEQQTELDLQYFTSKAYWEPIYHLDYDPQADTIELKTAALVNQSSGENWDDIDLELSTSTLSGDITVPTLKSWILAEKQEYIPKAKAQNTNKPKERFDAPQKKVSLKEAQKGAQKLAMQNQVQNLRNFIQKDSKPKTTLGKSTKSRSRRSSPSVVYQEKTEIDFEAIDIEGQLKKPQGMITMERAKAQFNSLPQIREHFNLIDPNTNIQGYDFYEEDTIQQVQQTNRAIPIQRKVAETGGLDYRWNAPATVKIGSDSQPVKVPLESNTFPVKTFYEATPSISKHAYLSAIIQNPSDKPILQGKTHIFIGDSYAGSEKLDTTGPKGTMNLALGMDENIRLKHNIIPKQYSKGLIGSTDITEYKVRIEIGNYKDKDIEIRIFDQIPLSEQEDVQIELLTKNLSPNRNGILKWDITVPAQKTEVIEFSYKIQRPKNWVIKGRHR